MDVDNNLDIKFQVIELLTRLGSAALSEYIGKEKLNRFLNVGHSLDLYSLAEILYTEKGINLFKNKELRLELLASFGASKLKEILSLEGELLPALTSYNNFNFSDNARSREFLSLFGINTDDLFEEKTALLPVEKIEIFKKLHAYQNWIRRSLNQFLRDSSNSRVIVHMPTGSGKTRTMLESVSDHIRGYGKGTTVVWLAHSEELCEQSVQSFKEIWGKLGSEEAQVIRMWGGTRAHGIDFSIPTFVVASFQTAYNVLSTQDDVQFSLYSNIKKSCSLLVVDEAHQSTAPTYKDVIELFSNITTKIVGLTATPGRHHVGQSADETQILSAFYQNNKINIKDDFGNELDDPIQYLTDRGVLAKVNRYKIKSDSNIKLTSNEYRHMERLLDIPRSVLEKLGRDEKRTNLIVTHAINLAIEKNLPTIIFAPSKENAVDIATMLKLKEVQAVAITSDTQRDERRDNIDKFKLGKIPILVNFGVLTTGFDAPNIKAVIIARPTTSVVLYSQMIGRGLRGPMMGGEEECYLVDVEDNIINMPKANQAFTYFDNYYN